MLLKKNIKVGKIRLKLFFLTFLILILNKLSLADNLNGEFTNIKVLDKIPKTFNSSLFLILTSQEICLIFLLNSFANVV